ncbi:MBL fold metallo-hydrolase [Alteribacillus bidgolensis]|uniref:Ribonuclease Z n=1 Tax=Alteribacillus bidgolensis TaxID=930129 RepID=A0A1G8QUR6_9BACI|nr:ribonuclease Z [Alteribacillus bidgolensis]SDJ08055.1 Ribonuclease BN, tRNA processing enzyme [Alteribacillus bidgolensis]
MYVKLLGTGSPKPNKDRSGPAQVVTVDETPVLVDCGEGTTRQLLESNINPVDIKHILFTHLHSDHVFGYGHFLLGGWSLGRKELTIAGPAGLKAFHEKILDMFKEDIDYRVSTLGISEKGLLDVNIIELPDSGGEVTLPDVNVDITSAPVVHNVKTFGFRFQKGEESIVISGDTAPVDSIVQLAKDADILIQDAAIASSVANNKNSDPNILKIWDILKKEHCTPQQAGEIAQEAGVKRLVLTHLLPNTDEEEAYQEASKHFDGEVIVGEDLKTIAIERVR